MTDLHAIILGAIQGLAEFLPISSSGHLIIFPWIFGWPQQSLTFDVALHIGTLFAIIIFFAKDWVDLIRAKSKLFWFLIIGCLPGAVAGVLFENKIETIFRHPLPVAVLLIVMGLVLWLAEVRGKRIKDIGQTNIWDAGLIGIAQALALMPGVSRSGITMSAGLFCGFKREAAARYSFLLSTPIIAGAGLLKFYHLLKTGIPQNEISPFLIGMFTAAVFGLVAIKYLLQFLQKHTFYTFIWYRFALGILVLGLAFWR